MSADVCRKLIFVLALAAISCGDSASNDKKRSTTFPSVEPLEQGLTFTLEPFRTGINVLLASRGNVTGLKAQGIATVPGVHWSWPANPPATMSIRSVRDGTWKQQSFSFGDALPATDFDLKYAIEFPASSWPVIVGDLDEGGGTIMLTKILKTVPTASDVPIRLYFFDGKRKIPARGGTSCGDNCVDFSGLVEATESPVSYFYSTKTLLEMGSATDFPWFVTFFGLTDSQKTEAQTEIATVRSELRSAWQTLSERWGTLPVGEAFQVHLMVQNGCGFQGLEHAVGTLLSVGYCDGSNFHNRLLKLAVHEMMHTWNGRYLYPQETATWNPATFSSARLNQLYFYEGVTEGFARILLGETNDELHTALASTWNSSASTLAGSLGLSLEEISRSSYSDAYEAGALLLLRMAAELRLEFGATVAREKLWGLLPALIADSEAGPFDLTHALWSQRCFSGGSFIPCNGGAAGYSSARRLEVMQAQFQLSNWNELVAAHFTSAFVATQNDLNAIFERVAAATGVVLSSDGSGRKSIVTSSVTGTSLWPL